MENTENTPNIKTENKPDCSVCKDTKTVKEYFSPVNGATSYVYVRHLQCSFCSC